jgi:predicted TIM-barrel fold metal-dependent hydrolase
VGGTVQGLRPEDEAQQILAAPCYATYQSDPIGVKLLDELGAYNIMWGSDFPHPDGVWPDSQEYIQRELGHLPAATRKKIVCDNAAKLYRFAN